jgi:PAS domain S-box-containing protein
MKKKSAYLLNGAMLLVTFSLIAIVITAILQSKKANQIAEQISKSTDFLFQSEHVLAIVVDNETGARGYVLTGKETFLEPLIKSKENIYPELGKLKKMLDTSRKKHHLFDSLSLYIQKRLQFSDDQINQRKNKGLTDLASLTISEEGKLYTDKIRLIIDNLQNEEKDSLTQYQQQSNIAQKSLNNFIITLVTALFILLFGLAMLIRRNISDQTKIVSVNRQLSMQLLEDVKKKSSDLENVLNRISDAFVAFDNNWNYIYVNKKAEEIIHFPASELIGKNVWKLFPEVVGSKFYHLYLQALSTQQYRFIEDYYKDDKGYDMWVENHIYPSPEGISIFFKNVTERKKHEQTLEQNALFINSLINSTPDVIYIYDILEHRNIYVNKGIQINLGYTDEEIQHMGNTLLSTLLHPDDLSNYLKYTVPKYSTLKDGELLATEYRMKHKEGNWCWISSKESIYLRNEDGSPKQIFGSARNITESKNVQIELEFSKEVLETAEEQAGLGSWSFDVETGKLYWSKQMFRLFGFAESNTPPLFADYMDKIHPDDRNIILDRYNSLITGEVPASKIYRSNPAVMPLRYFSPSLRVIKENAGKVVKMLGIVVDVTEQVLAEKEIENRAVQLKTLSDNLPGTMIYQLVMDPDGHRHFVYVSKSVESLTGYSFKQVIDNPSILYNLIYEEDRELFNKAEEESIKNMTVFNVEVRGNGKHGKTRWLNIRSMPRRLGDGSVIWDGVHTDITERKNTENEIVESEKRYRNTLDKMLEGIQIISYDWKYLYLNNAACKQGAHTKEELLGHTMMEKYPGIEKTELFTVLKKCMEERTQQFMLNNFAYPDGHSAWFELSIQPVPEGLFILSIDVTERKKAQYEIQNVNKELHELSAHLETVREEERMEIARDIHDELGQQLTGLKLGIEWVSLKIPENDELLREKTKEIIAQTKSIIQAVRRISANLRPSMLDDLGLAAALEWQSQETEKRYGIVVQFETTLNIDLPMKITNSLFRIYQETLTNAVRHSEASLINSLLHIKENNIILQIEDNGKGFDLNKKTDKKSFGLLGIKERAYSIGGICNIKSLPGKGTTIEVIVPLIKGDN